jgi:putative ABC transport system permease protein
MSRLLGLRARLRDMFWRRDADARMDEEMRFHLEMEAEKHQRAGLDAASAVRRSRADFGGVERHRDVLRDARRIPFVDALLDDLRFGARSLRRDAVFTLVAVATLAVGIGMATTMFSVVNGIALEEREVAQADNVSVFWVAPPQRPTEHLPISYATLNEYTKATHAFSGVAGVIFQGAVSIVMTDGPRVIPIAATWVTGNFFAVLGVTPVLGRRLEAADDAVGAAPVMVISFAAWQQHYGGASSAVGQRLEFNGKRYTVVGVMPAGFEFPRHADAWLPVLPTYPATQETGRDAPDVMVFDAVGRRHANVSPEAASADFASFLGQSDARRPLEGCDAIPRMMSFSERMTGEIRGTLLLASVAVGLLLLIACVNVANLLFLRGTARTQELAIRSALGAGRGRLIRQLITEASIIAGTGGMLAVAMSWLAVRAIRVLAPANIPHRSLIELNARVVLVALGITAIATILSGLLPAAQRARRDLSLWLRGGRAMSGVHRHTERLRRRLVVGQIALAVVVVISAGLVTRSLRALQHVDMGFDGSNLLILETLLPPDAARAHAADLAAQEAMIARIAALPGVLAVSAMPKPPYAAEGGWMAPYGAEGQSEIDRAANPVLGLEVVSSNYFEAMAIPILTGRSFTDQDRDGTPSVIIISTSIAQQTWPGQDPIGRRIKLGPRDSDAPWMTVIGVAAETRYRDLATIRPTLYMPAKQFAGPAPLTLAVRTRDNTPALRTSIRRALVEAVPAVRIASDAAFAERIAAPLARPRFGAVLFNTFALVTLLLSALGIYGAMAALVRERQLEFGIRLALGEHPRSVFLRIVRHGAILTLLGVCVGVALALVGTRALRSLLFDVHPTDPTTFTLVVAVVLITAGLACLIPALRAARVSPMDALRRTAA